MCCLFGLLDPRHILKARQKNRLVNALAVAAEARGTDATGIAYNSGGQLCVYKRPLPAHGMDLCVPQDVIAVMGHTRMTTQGSELKNHNNHPFLGRAGTDRFALAHNGMLYNDKYLRSTLHLPRTKIETDSYIGVQLIQRKKALDFTSLKYMAEQVEGSFCFTLLDQNNALYIVKGDNPICLYYFPALGLYIYASTEEILRKALSGAKLPRGKSVQIPISCGDILKIRADGERIGSQFDVAHLHSWNSGPWMYVRSTQHHRRENTTKDPYLEELKQIAASLGYTPEAIERLAGMGFCAEEIEEWMYECFGCEAFSERGDFL